MVPVNPFHADNITEVVRKAFKVAVAEKPGVTVIELPEDLAKLDVKDKPLAPVKVRRPAADHKAIAQAVELIGQASNPIILAGNETRENEPLHNCRAWLKKQA